MKYRRVALPLIGRSAILQHNCSALRTSWSWGSSLSVMLRYSRRVNGFTFSSFVGHVSCLSRRGVSLSCT